MLQRYDERNADLRYWVNGRLIHRDQPGLSPFDSVVQGGDAVWEGLRLYRGAIFGLREHLARLRRSATALGFADIPGEDEIVAAVTETLRANDMYDGVHVRLTLTRGVKVTSGMDPRLNTAGATLIVLAEHKPPVYDTSGLRLATASVRRPGPDVLDPKIHHANLLNSILAKIEANDAGADDALMLDMRGFVAETNATHVFLARNGEIATSRVIACPEGITRATVLEICEANEIPHQETELTLDDVFHADEMLCTGTMGELAGVIRVDGRTIGSGEVGPMTHRLSGLFAERTASEGVEVV
jgi:branched-chain amino acid aminotransferase